MLSCTPRHLAALLLVLPLSMAGALPASASAYASTVSTAEDSDGDGVPDSGDGCPTVPAGNPTGCPTVSRKASLTWLDGKQRLQVRISSAETACVARARIVVWRVRPDRDFKVAGANASFSGRARFKVPRRARYYVSVSPSYSPGVAECGRATSRTVRVPR
ncbi:thrombospondin type 3 repeat-containing protein [Nocardioides furvisabuli]|uniref:Uncharacterized protein n=1 Tax=Nocardioides furvisabuli TaxID=375542 RepID=A0ABN2X6K1_9ACTN|nr:thrombospondin type 3 repeat-containing protein [Nocardioides furvisabuli]